METVALQHIAMLRPTADFIYAPNDRRPVMSIPYSEFVEKFADKACNVKVSFEPDGVSNPQSTTAYANGLDCWYIVV